MPQWVGGEVEDLWSGEVMVGLRAVVGRWSRTYGGVEGGGGKRIGVRVCWWGGSE